MKANEMHYFSHLFDKLLYKFWTVHCPSSGVSQLRIQAIGICHASSVGCLLAWSGWNCNSILTTLTDNQQNKHDKYLLHVYRVELLLMMDSGLVRNM